MLIHGYGASSALFYTVMRELSEHFHCIFFDILGMGGSTRRKFECETADEAEEYLLDSVEKWRIAMDITDFYLVGHSFGGYLAGLYSSKYTQHVKKLICISPIGFEIKPEGWDISKIKQRKVINHKGELVQRVGPPRFVGYLKPDWIWSKKITPHRMFRALGARLTKAGLARYVSKRLSTDSEDEKEALQGFLF